MSAIFSYWRSIMARDLRPVSQNTYASPGGNIKMLKKNDGICTGLSVFDLQIQTELTSRSFASFCPLPDDLSVNLTCDLVSDYDR
jgi:hypothetical protein